MKIANIKLQIYCPAVTHYFLKFKNLHFAILNLQFDIRRMSSTTIFSFLLNQA